MKDDFIFFFKTMCPFSNWYLSPFIVNGIKYNCGEQYMMRMKALEFGDLEIAQEIMKELSPRKQKAWGREVRGFDQEQWNEVCEEIMIPGLVEKFISTPELTRYLLNTGDKILVEASPYDKVWGIGLSEDNSLAWDQSTWKGKNLLGKVLMRTRDVIRG